MENGESLVISRTDHLEWCKGRALEYVEAGDLSYAVSSMVSDLLKHPEVSIAPSIIQDGMLKISFGGEAVRRWIEDIE